jgi:hypothetical protein
MRNTYFIEQRIKLITEYLKTDRKKALKEYAKLLRNVAAYAHSTEFGEHMTMAIEQAHKELFRLGIRKQ